MTLISRLPARLPGVTACRGLALALLASPVVSAQDELVSAPPEERSTPESIRFSPVDEEQLGNTSIEGALGPSAAGAITQGPDPLVEPVYLSDELRRALDLNDQELQSQREQLIGPVRGVPVSPTRVQLPGYQNRTYDPASESRSTFRD